MLQHLIIENLAVVKYAEINFATNMTVITGETGSGKSIIIDALNLAFGARKEGQIVRPNHDHAEISVCFSLEKLESAILWLQDLSLIPEDNPECIIRRIIYQNGRTKAFINGKLVTTQQLKMLGSYLIQLHGQHQQQLLLKSFEQLRLLDAFGAHDKLLSSVKTAYENWDKLVKTKASLTNNNDNLSAKIELLTYQISELDNLDLQSNELEDLYQEHDSLANSESAINTCQKIIAGLDSDDEYNIGAIIAQSLTDIKSIYKTNQTLKTEELANATECLTNAEINLQEAINEISNYVESLEVNHEKLAYAQARIELIHDLARKHKVDPLDLPQHHQKLIQELESIEQNTSKLEKIDSEIEEIKNIYFKWAKQLTLKRELSAKKLASLVTHYIKKLGMSEAQFKIELSPILDRSVCHSNGLETAMFLISANPGHPPQPINKIASGGEISRISLALELVTAHYLATPCLVFDEVDVGIGGKTGAIVGQALSQLSKAAQVICVTHLPQVAACGSQHLKVEKNNTADATNTKIIELTPEERKQEIARMLGGLDITEKTLANAEELLGV